ncbi:MAG TPA: hypothetical protein DCE23_03860, partial [Firmicutes bacterium]|nr:hypothetical protein [Bacillota bacterium]
FLLIILVICVTFILSSNKDSKTFYLEDSYYGESKMIELNIDELNDLIDKKESFAVFLYQPSC